MRKSIIGSSNLALNLIAAILIAQSEGNDTNCPFAKPLKCSLDPSRFTNSFEYFIAMVDKSEEQAKYYCTYGISNPLKLHLGPLAFNKECESFQYYFDGNYLELSMHPSKKFTPITTMEVTTKELNAWQVKMNCIKWFGEYYEAFVVFNIGHEKLMIPKAFWDNLLQQTKQNIIAEGSIPITFSPPKKPSFTIIIDYRHIVFHSDDKWVFGREAMKLHAYSFHKKDSKISIHIGNRNDKGRESIDVGKGTELDRLKKNIEESPLFWNVNESKDDKSQKKQTQRSVDDQYFGTKLGWKNERVVSSMHEFPNPSSFPYERHGVRRRPGRDTIHKKPGLEDQLHLKSGGEYAASLYYREKQIGSSSSSHISHPTNSHADHESQMSSELRAAHQEHSTTGQDDTGFLGDYQNEAGSTFSFQYVNPTYPDGDTSLWWNPVRIDATDTQEHYGQQSGNEDSHSGQ